MPKSTVVPQPAALAVGLLEDAGRALFLVRRNMLGVESVELPCALVSSGENPVAALANAFRQQTGIDGQVHEILFERRHNAGTRKRKHWIPVLVFKITAKSASAKPGSGFAGCKWISSNDIGKFRLARMCQWL